MVNTHNLRQRGQPVEINLSLRPDPFIGSLDAPIWLLNLNPGLDPRDLLHPPAIVDAQKRAIELRYDSFWWLDPTLPETPGRLWWSKNMGPILRQLGLDVVLRSFCCIELFPYHSKRYRALPSWLPSQAFTASLVDWACEAGKSFVFMRAKREWLELVPELKRARTVELRNKQNPWVSPGNMTDLVFFQSVGLL